MRRSSIAAMLLASVALSGPASAGDTFLPSSIKVSVGSTTDAEPIPAVSSVDGSYLSIQSRPVRAVRKVVYVATFSGVPTNDNTMEIRVFGHAGLGESCDLHFAAFDWRKDRFIEWSFVVLNPGPADQNSATFRSDATRFVSAQGKFKAKMTCVDEANFTMRTNRLSIST